MPSGYGVNRKEIEPHWWRDLAELDEDRQDDPEPDEIEAEGFDDGQQHRQRHVDHRDAVNEAAQHQIEDDEGEEECPLRQSERQDPFADGAADARIGERRRQDLRADDDQGHHAGGLDGRHDRLGKHLLGQAAITRSQDERASRTDGGGFRGRREPEIDAAEHGDEKAQHGEDVEDVFGRRTALRARIARRGERRIDHQVDGDIDHEDAGHQQARQHARHEEARDRFFDQRAIQHHDDRRRDEDAERAAGRQGSEHGFWIITALQHFRDGYGADGRGGGYARSAHGGEDGARKDVGVQQAAGQPAQQNHDSAIEIVAGAAAQDEFAHQQEHRDRDQDVAVGGIPDDG